MVLTVDRTLDLEPVNPRFVAVVRGVDLGKPLSPADIEEIERTIWTYGVLVFPDQPLTLDQQVAFTAQFGPLDTGLQTKLMNRTATRLGHDAVTDISNVDTAGQVADREHKMTLLNVGNAYWHTDSSYEHHPFRYSVLAATTAVSWGGETQFADLRDAYDTLDERTRALIADRTATFFSHNTRIQLGIADAPQDYAAYPPVRWPMVRTHPGSGRELLWVDSKVVEISGMSVPEGRALAHELIEHIGQRERVYSHRWRPDDVVMWDNRSVLHRGRRFDLSERREMRRVSTKDDSSSLGEVGLGGPISAVNALVPAEPAAPKPAIRDRVGADEWALRVDLAACYRLLAHFGIQDLIYNHVSARVPGPGHHFLINSYGMTYDEVTASSLQKIDIDGNIVLAADNGFGVNPAGFIIHSAIHGAREDAGCVIHSHTRATVAVSAGTAGLLPLSQSAMFFHGEVSSHDFQGSAVHPEERARLVADLGSNDVMLLRNHGTLTVGRTVKQAFLMAYQFENACRIQIDALSAGAVVQPDDAIAASVNAITRNPQFSTGADLEWRAMLRLLDRRYPGYAQ